MAKRITVNQYTVDEDGNGSWEPAQLTRAQIMHMINDPANLPKEFAKAAGDWEMVNWWFTPGTEDFREVLFRTTVEVTDLREQLVAEILSPNKLATEAAQVRQYRQYVDRRMLQDRVIDTLGELVNMKSRDARLARVKAIREILASIDAVPAERNKPLPPKSKASKSKATKVGPKATVPEATAEEVAEVEDLVAKVSGDEVTA
jgi:hypothetical protein